MPRMAVDRIGSRGEVVQTLDAEGFDVGAAQRAAQDACAVAGLGAGGLRLLRLGDHAVFALDGGRVVCRVGRDASRVPEVRREVAVARWLADAGFPAVRLAAVAVAQPVVVGGRPVTFWQGLSDSEAYADTGGMGRLLHRLHALPLPPDLRLPRLDPFATVGPRLAAAHISEVSRAYLAEMAECLSGEYVRLEFALQPGHVHGDFNVGNVLLDAVAGPTLIDLDGFATGPREWDLVSTAMYEDDFGWHTAAEYAAFTAGYGFDVRDWPGYRVLRAIRELLMITWLSQNTRTDPHAADEVDKRVHTLRTGASRRTWRPF